MPIPILILIAGGIAAIAGGAAGISGTSKIHEAEEMVENARKRYDLAVNRLGKSSRSMNEKAALLGRYKMALIKKVLPAAINLLDKNAGLTGRGRVETISAESMIPSLRARLENQITALDAAGIGIQAIGAGSAAGSGVCALVGILGTASTGTAIGTLSGAAAHSATMAWLGGGSLAAGGAGMAGGALVLGGLVIAPAAILVGGIALAAKAEKVYTEGLAQSSRYETEIEKIDSSNRLVKAVETRVEEIHEFLIALESRLRIGMGSLAKGRSRTFRGVGSRAKEIRMVSELVAAILDVIEVPVFDVKRSRVSVESERVLFRYRKLVD